MTVAAAPSPAQVLDSPLDDLLTQTGTVVIDCSITDREFLGAVVQRKSGDLVLAMPTGRSELEHDTMARYLIAQVFDVDLPKLPPPFETTRL